MSTFDYDSIRSDLNKLAAISQELLVELISSNINVQSAFSGEPMDQHSKEFLQYKLEEIIDVIRNATLKW